MQINKNQFLGLVLSVVVFIILYFLYTQTNLLDGLEYGSVNFRFYLRDPSEKAVKLQEGVRMSRKNPRSRDDIIILGIDENTIREFDNEGIKWPFPWNYHTKFTRYVGSGEPKAMFFDIMFLDHKPYEEEFAKAIKEANCVFLDYPFETEEIDVKYTDIEERMRILDIYSFPVDPQDNSVPWVEEAVPPTPLLSQAAIGLGFANIRPDADHVNRKVPLVIKYKGRYYPSIDLLIVMHYYGITKKDITISMGNYIKLSNIPRDKMAKPTPDNSITIPIDDEGFMDINFIGGPGSFTHYPYYYFCRDGKIQNTSLKDKIILVAAYASTGISTDIHKSPYGDLFGIEHHANALNTILNQDFILKFTPWQNLLILLFISLLLGFILTQVSIVVSVAFTLGLVLFYIIGSYLLFDIFNIITIFATPIIQVGTTFSIIIAYRVLTEQQEKKYIRQTFSKFVSKTVVDELLKHPDKLKLGGDKKILTVLFSDIRSFTTISEKMTPEELVEHLNEYLQAMTELVFKYDGTLDKYVGDEIMAFWGAPIPQDNHALLACKCAVEMMQVLEQLNKRWVQMNKPALHIGIGINTGEMVVGNMGSASRMDYTLMGDNVNLGARLEGTNKQYGTGIIISEFTYEHVKDHVIARELDLVRVKGKQLPVKIYELIDIKE
ncbi:MAG TPA: adenylate/guanylate cyclase domain-containing protein [Spirochaetota bacterium]|nr:adenylate/guanylate cyclase domain-containing protein [Spirochaetota bacterium]HOM09779.1 adenylate/guanylate cyclase domain-containing protein [Spirochaetota bacterium]HPP49639.1 adenylate/guanylate cyclase domain-containing protein [Spirochaetota bacterium]